MTPLRKADLRSQNSSFSFRRFWACGLLCLLTTACSSGPELRDRYFRLIGPISEGIREKASSDLTVMVEPFHASGILASERNLLYRDMRVANETRTYPRYFWEEQPAVMIRDRVARFLQESGRFRNVVGRDRHILADVTLEGTLESLEQRVDEKKSEIVLRMSITALRTKDDRVLSNRSYEVVTPTESLEIEKTLESYETALARVLKDLEHDLAQQSRF
ncbi:cholesterol transport system auxiliary component [Azospirillaceae bacterium]